MPCLLSDNWNGASIFRPFWSLTTVRTVQISSAVSAAGDS